MLRYAIHMILLVVLFLAPAGTGLAAGEDSTALGKIATVEKVFYGSEQAGAILERLNNLEKDAFGSSKERVLINRINALYSFTLENSAASTSLITRLNAVEWSFSHTITQEPVKVRLEQLEQNLLGSVPAGPIGDRLHALTKLTYGEASIEASAVNIPEATLVKIRLLSNLDSNKSKSGDNVLFRVADDVYVDDVLVIPTGSYGYGKVKTVQPKKSFGRDAKLEVEFNSVEAMDGSSVVTLLGDEAKEKTRSMAYAAGASVAGLALLGPVGLVGGLFVHGNDIVIPPGTEMYIQVAVGTPVYGVKLK
ncbi:hypothetical protein [Acetonema longum]|uniref:PEGA domain-containing protein n=1 Tax=Acetonema longum DSM 6540 TaxID=1009370 RepID=F7NLY9_9FIRM|nr:hypothetical protein [Acetonema longum]EGO62915.1 hypothetical protein ALO_15577 [Acetonema longum DSM 6540]